MTPERWEKIKGLFEAAVERPRHERGTFLDTACAGDADLRQEVETLLTSDQEGKDFIETPVHNISLDVLLDDPQGLAETMAGYAATDRVEFRDEAVHLEPEIVQVGRHPGIGDGWEAHPTKSAWF